MCTDDDEDAEEMGYVLVDPKIAVINGKPLIYTH